MQKSLFTASASAKLRILQLVPVIFFTVSGGPYGLEPLLAYAGDHASLFLLLVVPMLWDVPAIFTVIELNGMMPVAGGYYRWVRYALGRRWGFFEGWWTWLYTFADLAIYPVLFVEYAGFFFPGIGHWKIPICLVIIWAAAALNIRGIVPVGKVLLVLSGFVMIPVIVVVAVFCWRYSGEVVFSTPGFSGITYPSLGLAMYTVMWNCFGWDNVTTYANEVDKPARSYFLSVILAFLLVMVVYVAIVLVAQAAKLDRVKLAEIGWPYLGEVFNSPKIGYLFATGGMVSALGLYAANLLAVSRLPGAMADDRLLPSRLSTLHPKYSTPYLSIIVCSVIISLMTFWEFGDLVIIDVTVYGAGLFLEYVSLVVLRMREPDRNRPFRVPLSTGWICACIFLPFSTYIVALSGVIMSMDRAIKPVIFAIAALASAELAWQCVKRFSNSTHEVR